MPRLNTACPVLVGCLFLAGIVLPDAASAQVVEGQVLEAEANRPVEGASVELVAGADQVLARVVTDGEGRFRIRARTTGTYQIRAGRIGFQTVTTPTFDLVRGEAPLEVEILLGVEAVPLAPLVVVSDRPARIEHLRLHIRGFYERERTWGRDGMGFGQFLGPEELQRRTLFVASDALRDLRGIRIEGSGGRGRTISARGGPFGRCSPPIYVDGVLDELAELDAIVSGAEVLAVEVYVGFTGPPEFVREDCGAIVVWTGVP